MNYLELGKQALSSALAEQTEKYRQYCTEGLNLNLSRGKPCAEQLDLSLPMLEITAWKDKDGTDCRNYGGTYGLDRMRRFWSEVTGLPFENIIVGGNSSLNMMFDTVSRFMLFGTANSEKPWCREEKLKFLCPAPGYDRHFRVTQQLGFELVTVPMTAAGPDMDIVEELVKDPAVKGIWCVPKYSNPTGITYSDEVVRRMARMKTAAPDFVVMWDNAYAVHDFVEEGDHLLDIFAEAKKCGTEDRIFYFSSTSKITFPGAGVAMMAASDRNLKYIAPVISAQTIGPDKLNQLRHLLFLPDVAALKEQMKRHAALIAPRFEILLSALSRELAGTGIASWTEPNGGYFVSLDVLPGCAKRVWELCRDAGVVLTEAGATFPYGVDPHDTNLRLAPTFCSPEDLRTAVEILCCAVKLAALEKLLER